MTLLFGASYLVSYECKYGVYRGIAPRVLSLGNAWLLVVALSLGKQSSFRRLGEAQSQVDDVKNIKIFVHQARSFVAMPTIPSQYRHVT
jgi:hypothetical protein